MGQIKQFILDNAAGISEKTNTYIKDNIELIIKGVGSG